MRRWRAIDLWVVCPTLLAGVPLAGPAVSGDHGGPLAWLVLDLDDYHRSDLVRPPTLAVILTIGMVGLSTSPDPWLISCTMVMPKPGGS